QVLQARVGDPGPSQFQVDQLPAGADGRQAGIVERGATELEEGHEVSPLAVPPDGFGRDLPVRLVQADAAEAERPLRQVRGPPDPPRGRIELVPGSGNVAGGDGDGEALPTEPIRQLPLGILRGPGRLLIGRRWWRHVLHPNARLAST